MRIEWLYRNKTDRVILFFNGWGMDARAVSHLEAECDIVMLNDYRSLAGDCPKEVKEYSEIYVVAWSMGVWAAANILLDWNIIPTACIALNGTERPIDDRYGIPCKVYALTEKGMNARGKEKFFYRMLTGPEQWQRFVSNKPKRELAEQCEELSLIYQFADDYVNTIKWNKVYISQQDVIFPIKNQLNWWCGKALIFSLQGGHYPFYEFKSWEEIIQDDYDR